MRSTNSNHFVGIPVSLGLVARELEQGSAAEVGSGSGYPPRGCFALAFALGCGGSSSSFSSSEEMMGTSSGSGLLGAQVGLAFGLVEEEGVSAF